VPRSVRCHISAPRRNPIAVDSSRRQNRISRTEKSLCVEIQDIPSRSGKACAPAVLHLSCLRVTASMSAIVGVESRRRPTPPSLLRDARHPCIGHFHKICMPGRAVSSLAPGIRETRRRTRPARARLVLILCRPFLRLLAWHLDYSHGRQLDCSGPKRGRRPMMLSVQSILARSSRGELGSERQPLAAA